MYYQVLKYVSNIKSELDNENIASVQNMNAQLTNLLNINKLKITQNTQGIDGLWYIQNYLKPRQIENISDFISNLQLDGITNSIKSRRVSHFGYKYSYNRSGLQLANDIPKLLASYVNKTIVNILTGIDVDENFNQVIINEYLPNQQIGAHIDHTIQFGAVIACLSIGAVVNIKFIKGAIVYNDWR